MNRRQALEHAISSTRYALQFAERLVEKRRYELVDLEIALSKELGTSDLAMPKAFEGWPDGKPLRYNACTDPCDMWTGPCACGAWHRDGV